MDIDKISRQLTQAGLVRRSSQLEMIKETYEALRKQKILCLEAPTGTGKTLSYSIGAYFSKKEKQNVIISTATIALQEQLIQKDLPLLAKILGVEIRAALAKGRRRYVCHARLYEEQQLDIFNSRDYHQQLRLLLEQGKWNGDRDQLELHITDAQWLEVSTDSPGCSGKLCSYFQQCVFFKSRQKWQQADFIVTNHSLLLSDLSLGSGALLPEMDKSIYIIDECHHFSDKALDHFAQSAPLLNSVDWINYSLNIVNRAVKADLIPEIKQKTLQELTTQLIPSLEKLQEFLRLNKHLFVSNQNQESIWRCGEDQKEILELAQPIQLISGKITGEFQLMLLELTELLKLSGHDSEKQINLNKLVSQLGFYYSQADNLNRTFQLFCQTRSEQEAPLARWFVKTLRDQYFCHVSPINISQKLKDIFWDKLTNGALLCSATLRASGDFNDFKRKSGLNNHELLKEMALESYFDYSKSVLFVPMMRAAPQGNDQNAHWQEALELLPELILPRTGTLVLFTSKSAMEKTYAQLNTSLQADILMQGALGKSILIVQHKEKINNNQRSVLFGLASFGEGLDLPAEYCQHVIIHKLPFAVPTTPIEETRNEWLIKNNRNPFELATLPATSIRLAQFTGRLIRHENDIGIVTILDKRLYSKSYGEQLIKGLPGFQKLFNTPIKTLKETASIRHLF